MKTNIQMSTVLAQAGTRRDERTGSLAIPIYQTASFSHPALGQSTGFDYSRTSNPTRLALEQTLAAVEGGVRGFAFASGLAAIDCALRLFQSGDRLVITEDLYGGTFRLFEKVFRPLGLAKHPGREILTREGSGFGGMIAFEVDAPDRVPGILSGVRVFLFAESLGGVESLVTYPLVQTHADMDRAICERLGINDRLLRLSVGIEDVSDLIRDLEAVL